MAMRPEGADYHAAQRKIISVRGNRMWASGFQPVGLHSMAAGYCGASARIEFDDEQFVALFKELQARGDKAKLMQLFGH